jgi:uncharacterized iron-regulated membrane protein
VKYWQKVHKWLGFIVAIQVLLWISGGVVMSVLPIEKVRGKHLINPIEKTTQPQYAILSDTLSLKLWQSVSWHQRSNKWVIKATDFDDQTKWLEPSNGEPVEQLSKAEIDSIATSRHANQVKVTASYKLKQIPFEVRHLSLPLYQVTFDDWINSTFYINPQSGDISSVRSDIWRLYDFFWMLHIMDYEEREDFNHPLLIAAALLSLAFTMTGMLLLYFSILKPWYARVKYRSQARM